jgi:hypothetical protein
MNIERTSLSQQEFDRWSAEAEKLVEESEALTQEQKDFLAVQEALQELNDHFMSMTVEDVEIALEGLREYAVAVLKERDITEGWVRYETEDTSL